MLMLQSQTDSQIAALENTIKSASHLLYYPK
jgi:hypothetical protein